MKTPNHFFRASQIRLTYEQLVVKCNEIGYVILTKTDSGFAVDVYQRKNPVTSVTVSREPELAVV